MAIAEPVFTRKSVAPTLEARLDAIGGEKHTESAQQFKNERATAAVQKEGTLGLFRIMASSVGDVAYVVRTMAKTILGIKEK